MKRLYSYLIRSFIGPFILTFLICIFVLLMQFLWKYLDDLIGKGLENSVIIELMSYAALSLVPLALPLAVLLASIMTFGNLGERFELLAIKASGVSLLTIMRPLIIFNIAITFLAFFLANEVIPVANSKFAALLWSVKKQRPEMIIKEGIFSNEIDDYSIKVSDRDKNTNALLDIMIYDHTQRKGNINVIVADSGYLNMSDDKNYMILTLYNGESYTETKPGDRNSKKTNPFRRENFEKEKLVINVQNFNLNRPNEKYFKNNYKMLNNRQIDTIATNLQEKYDSKEEIVTTSLMYNRRLNSEIKNSYYPDSIKVDTLFAQLIPIQYDSVYNKLTKFQKKSVLNGAQRTAQQNLRIILQYESDLGNKLVWINKHWVEWHKKYTLSLACIIFFFIGAPLGAIIRKGGFGMPVVVSILLFISYYLISVIGEKVAREGVWKIDMVLWVPTVFYLLIGVLLTHQAVTDSWLLSTESYAKHARKIGSLIVKARYLLWPVQKEIIEDEVENFVSDK
ncbi:MAG: LptF/LptG family permease [Prolixibacteraceae bacterium]|jgi:lipopolysaccharide export system permease protein|nr:LptF/LptG family permease [Prolixibacteraceae bacterium]